MAKFEGQDKKLLVKKAEKKIFEFEKIKKTVIAFYQIFRQFLQQEIYTKTIVKLIKESFQFIYD